MGADRTTYGPPSANGINLFDSQALVVDQTNGVLYVSGQANGKKMMAAMGAPLVLPAQTALTAITTAKNLLSFVFQPGALNVIGRKIRAKGFLIYSTTAANVSVITIGMSVAYNGGQRVICSIPTDATNTAASANLPIHFDFEFTVVSLGATATLEVHGKVNANIGTVAAASVSTYLDTNIVVQGAVNLTGPTTVNVTIAGSTAIPSAQLRSATLMYEA